MNINERITNLRKKNNLTQEEFANKLFLTRQAVSKYERGISIPSIDTLILISKTFNISLDELLGINALNKSKEYKSIGHKNFKVIVLYVIMLTFILLIDILFNYFYFYVEVMSLVLVNILFILIILMLGYMLIKAIFPLKKSLIEYNDFGIKLYLINKVIEIPFSEIKEIKTFTHGNYDFGRIEIIAINKKFSLFPIKDLNNVKSVIEKVKTLNK